MGFTQFPNELLYTIFDNINDGNLLLHILCFKSNLYSFINHYVLKKKFKYRDLIRNKIANINDVLNYITINCDDCVGDLIKSTMVDYDMCFYLLEHIAHTISDELAFVMLTLLPLFNIDYIDVLNHIQPQSKLYTYIINHPSDFGYYISFYEYDDDHDVGYEKLSLCFKFINSNINQIWNANFEGKDKIIYDLLKYSVISFQDIPNNPVENVSKFAESFDSYYYVSSIASPFNNEIINHLQSITPLKITNMNSIVNDLYNEQQKHDLFWDLIMITSCQGLNIYGLISFYYLPIHRFKNPHPSDDTSTKWTKCLEKKDWLGAIVRFLHGYFLFYITLCMFFIIQWIKGFDFIYKETYDQFMHRIGYTDFISI